MITDPFSDLLKLTNAEAVVTGGFTAGGPWAIRFPGRDKIKFFAVVKGSCWVTLKGEAEPKHFETGDVGLLARRRSFVLASDLSIEPVDAMDLFSGSGRTMATLGDGGDFAHIGGHVLLDPIRGGLLADILPLWIHTRASSPHAAIFRWLLDRLIEERDIGQPGAQLASAQLTQLLFIEILRSHLNTSNLIPAGWLRALADPRIAPALRLMHGDPARAWHLEDLAKACAMSRTSFAFNFRTAAGVAPIGYLTEWRMRLAERALREDKTPVAIVARSLGYTSESAFSNAFKRVSGSSPTAYRGSLHASDGSDGEPLSNQVSNAVSES
ncbi:AraC family transcriptional regulator [Rhizobium indigoferae]|uniref:AraC family transcriptional regulator n=1 Tax=Rhizobium indigoferae TaxID=158891 RepID=A0ABZ0Z7U5_9HYPH|nr:AraC family transcriptional regulator [Rhizobium indigoferae]NNU53867.1 AraC family transcriptional regulator [Rhizobium indigoferae]WQN35630.1 AraC family transcriptional regulator [Rhizobium indigoferae]GLR61662.1 AraC family transcriptional regulator [Rhizobium indigoferae]